MKSFSINWLRRNRKLGFLMALILVEGALVGHLWLQARQKVPFGFLVKSGQSYILIWKAEDETYHDSVYYSLPRALAYANTKLGLEAGRNPFMADELERSWTQDRSGNTVVFWKTIHLANLNQLTFRRRADANYFLQAFRAGNYTTSPFGHSIFLRPTLAE